MARIIYGVCGEGMGHAIRSKLLLDHLSKKHEIKIFSSRGAFSFLSKHFEDVQEVQGLSIAYRNNRVSKIETVFHNILNVFGLIRSFREVKEVMDRFKPDIIISDYEIISAYAALVRRVPLVSVDNQHIIKGKISFPKKFIREYIETVIVNRINIPAAKHYIVTSFFKPEKISAKLTVVPPIVRDAVLNTKENPRKSHNNFILVYQTSDTNKKLIESLKRIDREFVVSGFNKEKKEKNIQFIKFNEKKFLKYLADCESIIANGGFTLISEALHLGKPVLSIPVINQFEQTLNAFYLDKLGYGKYSAHADKENITDFINNLDGYRDNLRRYNKQDNSLLIRKMDGLIRKASSL